MKNSILVICLLAITSASLFSFKGYIEKKFGGTASASGKVTYVTDYEITQGRKVGDIEPVDVSVDCRYDDNAAAKSALKSEIENDAAVRKIKITSSINYDVTSCDN